MRSALPQGGGGGWLPAHPAWYCPGKGGQGGFEPSRPVTQLRILGDLDHPCGQGDGIPLQPTRAPLAVPALMHMPAGGLDPLAEPQPVGVDSEGSARCERGPTVVPAGPSPTRNSEDRAAGVLIQPSRATRLHVVRPTPSTAYGEAAQRQSPMANQIGDKSR